MRTLLLLTRYNAAIPGLAGRPGLDPGWLDARLRLFRDWPLPAVRAQARRPDRWLLFVDAATPAGQLGALRAEIEGLGELVPVAGPLEDRHVRELVSARLGDGVRELVSARLDSDDALAASYLARVWSAAQGWHGFVNAPLGYRLSDGRLLRCRDREGPFLSFAERLDGGLPSTVLQVPHHEAARRGPVRQLDGPPAWLQVVHGGNLANRFCGWPASAARACDDLGVEALRGRVGGGRLGLAALVGAGGQLRRDLVRWTRRAGGLR